MTAYFIIFFFNVFAGFLWNRKKVFDLFLINMMVLCVAVFIGLKYEVGTDHYNYLRAYNKINNDTNFQHMFPEFGYYLINRLAGYFDWGLQFSYVVSGALMSFFTYRAAYILKINPFFFFAIVFPFHIVMLGISGVRQGVAESIFIFAFAHFLLSNTRRYLIGLFFACTFHLSAVFFVFYKFIGVKRSWLTIYALVATPLMIYIFEYKYSQYVGTSLYNQGAYLRVGFLVGLSVIFFVFIKKPVDLKEKRLFTLIIYLPLVMLVLIPFFSTLMDRISYYFILTEVLLFMFYFRNSTSSNNYLFSMVLIISASFFGLIVFSFFGNNAESYQYKNVVLEMLFE
jgi:hypothetical protein